MLLRDLWTGKPVTEEEWIRECATVIDGDATEAKD